MSFLGGALEKQDPAERVKLALLRDLELRRNDSRSAERFSGGSYYYRGGADLALREGKFMPGRVRPSQYDGLVGPMGQCFGTSLAAALANPALTYVEGYCTSGQLRPFAHGWCIDGEGVVDLTLPAGADEWRHSTVRSSGLPFLPPDRWGYWGLTFTAPLAEAHLETHSLPMLDRSYGEMAEHDGDTRDFTEPHDFPILKVPYREDRTELP